MIYYAYLGRYLLVIFPFFTASSYVKNVQIVGKLVDRNVIKGTDGYVGGKEGPSRFEWYHKKK